MAILNNKYNNSFIYTIRSPHTNKFYIGSTTQSLCRRFANHKSDYNTYVNNNLKSCITSFKIIELGDSYIELLERFDCEDKNELEKREGELIRLHKDLCINKQIPGRTGEQYRLDNAEQIKQRNKQYTRDNADKKKQYYVDNIDRIKQRNKQYHFDNTDNAKQYYLNNADKIKQSKKQYYIDNADKIKQCRLDNADRINKRRRQQRLDNKKPKINIAKEDYDFLICCDKLMNLQYSYKHFIIVE